MDALNKRKGGRCGKGERRNKLRYEDYDGEEDASFLHIVCLTLFHGAFCARPIYPSGGL